MKKTLNYLGMAVAIALAFTACNRKEEDTSANRAGEKHYVTFNLGKDVDTKTMVVEGTTTATYKWCATALDIIPVNKIEYLEAIIPSIVGFSKINVGTIINKAAAQN